MSFIDAINVQTKKRRGKRDLFSEFCFIQLFFLVHSPTSDEGNRISSLVSCADAYNIYILPHRDQELWQAIASLLPRQSSFVLVTKNRAEYYGATT
mmetsp:Transcript_28362/g.41418  ORF Transcript_28362/g.41418 Transcript_28362/m.41418 type:complete len:96 (+) Transcript_28362:128-415(+)